MSDRLGGIDRVILVHIQFPSEEIAEDLDEFKELASSAGAEIVAIITGNKKVPEAKYFVGSGKAEEIRDAVEHTKANLVILNHNLSPAQERNLEQLIKCRVLDRTGLILDIFAQRARSFEGRLQVELALLKHQSTRLIRGWTHLERQRGGIGLRGGPGETQLEVDRRLIRKRIKTISAQLAKIRQQREQGRRSRRRADVPTIALVGYTNAGKSTLFNLLTGAHSYVANQLFATLDPTLRRFNLPEIGPVVLADTVGFIRHLPHDLIIAFHATLEEVTEASLLLHVVDAHDEAHLEYIAQVENVLETIGAASVPSIYVYNKIDLLPGVEPHIERHEDGTIRRVWVSAQENKGIADLFTALIAYLHQDIVEQEVTLNPTQSKLRAFFYERDAVLAEQIDESGFYHMKIRFSAAELKKLLQDE